MQFTPEKVSGPRLRVQGVVTLAKPGRFPFVQDASGAVEVMSSQNAAVQPGDCVDAVGFRAARQYAPIQEDGEFRRIGRDTLPTPSDLTRAISLSGGQDTELVKIQGGLSDQSIRGEDLVLTMQMAGFTFPAQLEKAAARLEMLGRQGDLAETQEAYAALRQEIERLRPALLSLQREVAQ